jgi:hypothetical protein
MGRWTDRPVNVVAVQILQHPPPLQSTGTPITRALAARRAHTGERIAGLVGKALSRPRSMLHDTVIAETAAEPAFPPPA